MPQRVSDQIRMFGKSRSHHAILPSRFLGVLDMTPSYGWHYCNDTYYFHRDKGSELFDNYLMILTMDGRGAARVEGREYALGAGSLMLFPREKPHTYFVPEGEHWEFYWIHMTGPGCSSIMQYVIETYGLYHEVDCNVQIREQIEGLLETEYTHPEFDLHSHQAIHAILQNILRCLFQPNRETARRKAQVSRLITYIETNYTKDLTLKEISSHAFLSEGHLIRTFHEETGMTPHKYLMQYRLRQACMLLEESDMSVSEISREVGYQSASTFTVQFKALYHTTPSEYRARCQKR